MKLNQVLHGYRNGHQLLASSCELDMLAKRTLLFQSDLSGSLSEDNFSTYITGYPIIESGLYAFARSWYAYEMKRPGCVWTQTLLIDFSDIGKFVDFSILLDFFKRPNLENLRIDLYSSPIEVDIVRNSESLDKNDLERKICLIELLYNFYDQPIYYASNNPVEWERIFISIWSDQWPRLRRNFTFCTGSLEKRELNGLEFDLQIVPNSSFLKINSAFEKYLPNNNTFVHQEVLNIILNEELKNSLRNFLWVVGSDIIGSRKNYISLLNIYNVYSSEHSSINQLIGIVSAYFPDRNEAKNLKKIFFGKNSVLLKRVNETELIKIIVRSTGFDSINTDDVNINKRILEQINLENISLIDFVSLWQEAPKGRLSPSLWEESFFSYDEAISEIIREDISVLNIIIEKFPKIVESAWVWEQNLSFQRLAFDLTKRNNIVDWQKVLLLIMNNHSLIIHEFHEYFGNDVINLSLDWLNSSFQGYFIYDWQVVLRDNLSTVRRWIFQNRREINYPVYQLIYKIYSHQILQNLNLPLDFWIRLAKTSFEQKNVHIATSALATGFNRKLDGGEWIILEVFQFVYDSASNSLIQSEYWKIIPNEDYVEEESSWFNNALSLFKYKSKRRVVYEWDYCELLIRSLVNIYIKYPLSKQAFVLTFKDEYSFYRALEYLLSLSKGNKFLKQLNQQLSNKSFVVERFQRRLLKRALEDNL